MSGIHIHAGADRLPLERFLFVTTPHPAGKDLQQHYASSFDVTYDDVTYDDVTYDDVTYDDVTYQRRRAGRQPPHSAAARSRIKCSSPDHITDILGKAGSLYDVTYDIR